MGRMKPFMISCAGLIVFVSSLTGWFVAVTEISGCTPATPVIRLYQGPELTQENLSILVCYLFGKVMPTTIDGRDLRLTTTYGTPVRPQVGLAKRRMEFHLLPGKHSMTVAYYAVESRDSWTESRTYSTI